jgi:hypothetical protein
MTRALSSISRCVIEYKIHLGKADLAVELCQYQLVADLLFSLRINGVALIVAVKLLK